MLSSACEVLHVSDGIMQAVSKHDGEKLDEPQIGVVRTHQVIRGLQGFVSVNAFP